MKFNLRKHTHIRIGKTGEPSLGMILNDTIIIPNKLISVKYLGITNHRSVKWSAHINEVAQKANEALRMFEYC